MEGEEWEKWGGVWPLASCLRRVCRSCVVAGTEGAPAELSHGTPTLKLHLRSGLAFLSSAWQRRGQG